MNWALYVTLLTEVALNPELKNQRNKLKKMAKTQTKHAKTTRGGFIIMGLAAIGAAIAGASTAGPAVGATAATVGTAIASSTVARAIAGGVVSATASAGVEATIDAV